MREHATESLGKLADILSKGTVEIEKERVSVNDTTNFLVVAKLAGKVCSHVCSFVPSLLNIPVCMYHAKINPIQSIIVWSILHGL